MRNLFLAILTAHMCVSGAILAGAMEQEVEVFDDIRQMIFKEEWDRAETTAIQALKTISADSTGRHILHNYLSKIYFNKGRSKETRQHMEMAYNLLPEGERAIALNNLMTFYAESGLVDEMLALFEEEQEGVPRHMVLLMYLAGNLTAFMEERDHDFIKQIGHEEVLLVIEDSLSTRGSAPKNLSLRVDVDNGCLVINGARVEARKSVIAYSLYITGELRRSEKMYREIMAERQFDKYKGLRYDKNYLMLGRIYRAYVEFDIAMAFLEHSLRYLRSREDLNNAYVIYPVIEEMVLCSITLGNT